MADFGCYCRWPPDVRKPLESVETVVAQPAILEVPAAVEKILRREAVFGKGCEGPQTNETEFRRTRGILRGVLKKDHYEDAKLREILEQVHTFIKTDAFFA